MRSFAASLAIILAACGPVVDDTDDGAADGDTSTGNIDAPPTMTTPATASGADVDDGAPDPTVDPNPTTLTTTATASDVTTDPTDDASATDIGDGSTTTTTTTSGNADACAPEPDDTACLACRKENCCAEIQECVDDPDCACVLACLDTIEMPGVPEAMACSEDCSVDFLEVAPALIAVQQCQDASCPRACPT
jgi:hypothetical protein